MLFSEIPHLGALQLQLQLVRNEGDELRIYGIVSLLIYRNQIGDANPPIMPPNAEPNLPQEEAYFLDLDLLHPARRPPKYPAP